MLARIRAEPGFFDAVVSESAPWKKRWPAIKAAAFNNATNEKHGDQWTWMRRFALLSGIDFPEEDE